MLLDSRWPQTPDSSLVLGATRRRVRQRGGYQRGCGACVMVRAWRERSKKSPVLAALLVVALLIAGLGVAPAPSLAAGKASGTLKLTPSRAVAGASVSFTGKFKAAKKRPVVLQRKQGKAWVKVAKSKTSAKGAFAFTSGGPDEPRACSVSAPTVRKAPRQEARWCSRRRRGRSPSRAPRRAPTPTPTPDSDADTDDPPSTRRRRRPSTPRSTRRWTPPRPRHPPRRRPRPRPRAPDTTPPGSGHRPGGLQPHGRFGDPDVDQPRCRRLRRRDDPPSGRRHAAREAHRRDPRGRRGCARAPRTPTTAWRPAPSTRTPCSPTTPSPTTLPLRPSPGPPRPPPRATGASPRHDSGHRSWSADGVTSSIPATPRPGRQEWTTEGDGSPVIAGGLLYTIVPDARCPAPTG